jgi:hypothetical protein
VVRGTALAFLYPEAHHRDVAHTARYRHHQHGRMTTLTRSPVPTPANLPHGRHYVLRATPRCQPHTAA